MMRSIVLPTLLSIGLLFTGNAATAAPAGQLDQTFGENGKRVFPFGPAGGSYKGRDLVQGPNGILYLIGDLPFDGKTAIGLAAFNEAGDPTESFDQGASLVSFVPPSFFDLQISDATVQLDGKIVVAGGGASDNGYQPLVCRFEPTGAVDTTFGNAGCRTLPLVGAVFGNANAVIVQSDGRIALAGHFEFPQPAHTEAFIAQLDGNGMPTDFGSDGIVLVPHMADSAKDTNFSAIVQTPDGSLVAAGDYEYENAAGDWDFLIAKVDQDGVLVDEFNDDGLLTVPFDQGDAGFRKDKATVLAVLEDGALLVGGNVQTGPGLRTAFGLTKLTDEGLPYPGFPTVTVDVCDATCEVDTNAMQIMPDGRIVTAGSYSDDLTPNMREFFVRRLMPDGSPDQTYGQYQGGAWLGFNLVDNASEDVATGLVLQGERVVVGGYCKSPGPSTAFDFCMGRLGHGLDTTFNVTPMAGPNGSLSPGDTIVVAHSDYTGFIVNPDVGYKVFEATGCGGSLVGDYYKTGPITEDCVVNVTFGPEDALTLTYAASTGGTVTGSTLQNVPFGEDGTPVTALPFSDYHFVQWSDGSLANPRQDMDVTSDIDVIAEFAINPYAVSVNAGANGTVVPDGMQFVEFGAVLQYEVSPDPGFAIDMISGCGGTLAANMFTTAPIAADCSVTVTFVASDAMYTLLYTTDGNGSLQGDSEQSVLSGSDGTPVTAVPAPGFVFVGWSDGMTMNPRQDTSVIADVSVMAQFAADSTSIFADGFED